MTAWILLAVYFVAMLFVFLFSICQFNLALIYRKVRGRYSSSKVSSANLPKVTIQLPVFNERYVVKRLIDAIAALDYPKELLEVQVLDDSTDETSDIIRQHLGTLTEVFDFKHIQRSVRTGYKAGALHEGLSVAQGELIAIFDADFVPKPDFLLRTVGVFSNPSIGMVQSRWSHINRDFGALTKFQAFWLDAHFSIEQTGRNVSKSFINFNGTAGVWRKECIIDAGGWSADTLSEDLDLSYRAQLKGWKFKYLQDLESPSELPVLLPSIRSQQYRWNKGAAESARKHIKNILTSSLNKKTKTFAVFHLLNSSVFVWLLIGSLVSVPMVYYKAVTPDFSFYVNLFSVFIPGFIFITFFYWVSYKDSIEDHSVKHFLKQYFMFLAFSLGLSVHNSIAVIEGFVGRKTPFVRTPKFNITDKNMSIVENQYLSFKLSPLIILEALLCIYFLFGLGIGFYLYEYGMMFLHGLMSAGLAAIVYFSIVPYKGYYSKRNG